MKAIYKNIQGLAVAMLLTAGFASCANDHSTDTPAVAKGNGSLTLNIHSDAVGMRAATIITDGGTTTTATNNEKTINDVTFGVFKAADGNKKGDIQRVTTPGATTAGYTQEFGTNVAEADKFAAGDSVVLAINIPEAVSFTGVTDKAGFYDVTLTAEQALTYGTGTVDATKLPKFGKSVLVANETTGNFTADVTVRHLVAKVSLASLTVDFADDHAHNGHAAFTPEEIFLYSVPDKLGLQLDENGKYCFAPGVAPTQYLQGESGTAGVVDYLGTGDLSLSQMTSGTLANPYTFYTMPNQAGLTTTDVNRTRLVIKGKYTEDKDRDATGHTAYYAINLGSTTDYSVDANNHYIVTATIKGDGASTVNGAIPNYQNLITTVTVADWEEEATAVTVDNGGYHYSMPVDYSGIQIGDIIYADGHYSTSYDATFAAAHGAPIAIVFSTTATDYDKITGDGTNTYKHGYAMALKNVDYYAAGGVGGVSGITDRWILKSGWCADIANADGGSTNLRNLPVTDELVYADEATVKADMNGLKHCMTAKANAEASSYYTLADLYAINTAMTFMQAQQAAPKNTIWFLPSIGQQYQWMVQLAGMPTTGYIADTAHSPAWYWYLDSNASETYANAMNTRLGTTEAIPAEHYDAFRGKAGERFWSSTERAAGYPFNLVFYTGNNLYLNGDYDKSLTNNLVRAVLAF